jgi:hypothetical protein
LSRVCGLFQFLMNDSHDFKCYLRPYFLSFANRCLFLFDLNLVIGFLISRIWSLGFIQILNRSSYHFFRGLSHVTCVSIDKLVFISTPNINVISLSAKLMQWCSEFAIVNNNRITTLLKPIFY